MVTLVNRAKVATATTGTGTLTLGSAESGYQSFADAGVVDTDVVRYVIEDGTAWEIGTGTYSAGTLTRTVLESSNADAALNLTGSAVVYVSATAEDIPPVLELYAENPSSPTAPSATGTNAVAIGFENTASGIYATAIGASSSGLGSKAVTGAGAMALGGSYASGVDSFAAAISSNSGSFGGATGANSVAIGANTRSTSLRTVCIGRASFATAESAIALGTGVYATGAFSAAIGNYASATAAYSLALGNHSHTESYIGKKAYASGRFSGTGDAQTGTFVLRSDTTDATPEALTTNNSTAGTTNQIILPNNSAYAFHGTIVARQQASAGTACAAWKIEGLIRREGSAGTTVLVNSATTILDNTPAWGMNLSADTTNGGLKIEVTGAAATNIRWVATINTSEVTY